PNFKRVTIALDPSTPLLENTPYTVTVSGIADPAGNILGSATVDFRSWQLGAGNGLLFESFGPESTANNNIDQTLLVDPNYPNNPRDRMTMPVFDTLSVYPDFSHEGYGARIRGLFIPPVSGPWVFHLASDDASRLFLNPNGPSA